MARRKERIFTIETPEENSLIPYNNAFINFVCKESNLVDCFNHCDKLQILSEPSKKKDIDNIIKNLGIKSLNFVDSVALYIDEISLSKPLKSSDGYIYRLRDYNENKHGFYTFNEVITYLKRKIKTKIVNLSYNGTNETVEFSEKELSNIITRMSSDTHDVVIVQVDNKNRESDLIIVTPFKIFV